MMGPSNHIATNHRLDERSSVQRPGRVGAHMSTIAEHRHPVGQREDLIQTVADDHDCRTAVTQLAQDGKDFSDFGIRQCGRRLIEQQHSGFGGNTSRDFDELLLGQ
ncbi:hypothetical protein D3C81_1757750 [compost metagenome]